MRFACNCARFASSSVLVFLSQRSVLRRLTQTGNLRILYVTLLRRSLRDYSLPTAILDHDDDDDDDDERMNFNVA